MEHKLKGISYYKQLVAKTSKLLDLYLKDLPTIDIAIIGAIGFYRLL
jgi:hypothetical protein